MLEFHGKREVEFCDGLTRRDFLKVGALSAGALSLGLPELLARGGAAASDRRCIMLFLVGGPSQLDTFDPKPQAPDSVRGPFRPLRTRVPGVDLTENFPLLAQRMDRIALVRSVHHNEAPIHETGHQLMQTGRLAQGGIEHPNFGAVLSHVHGPSADGVPPWLVLPDPIGNTGVSVGHGQTAGYLGPRHDAFFAQTDPARPGSRFELLDAVDAAQRQADDTEAPTAVRRALDQLFAPGVKKAFDLQGEPSRLHERYGSSTFGQSCLLARRLVEQGVRLVTVNMFESVFDRITWDCHADGGALGTDLEDYRDTLCPMLDRAYSALLDDLAERGLLEKTLVVATGEFGRTPHLNPRGGRDHWPGCWSVLLAGGGVKGGRVLGSSDAIGGEPKDRPVTPAELAATVYHSLGIDPATRLPGPEATLPLADAAPLRELF